MTLFQPSTYERIRGAAPAVAVHLLLLFILLRGLDVAPAPGAAEPLKVLDIAPVIVPTEQPPPPPPPAADVDTARQGASEDEGAASPPNLESRATPLVAPQPERPTPSPIRASEVARDGSDVSSGAAKVSGPGTGSGGVGTGTGDAGGGSGAGGGGGGTGDGRGLRPPRRLRGRIYDSDYPPGLGEAGIGGTVGVHYAVETDGRVTDCTITRSSGNAQLDRRTCEVIEARFRYRPSLDPARRPVRSFIVENHEWVVQDLPEEEREKVRRRRRIF